MEAGKAIAEKEKETDPGSQWFSEPVNGQKGKQQRTTEIEEKDDRCPKRPRLSVNIRRSGIPTEFRSWIPFACGLHDDNGNVYRS